jgi:hypothetical protein
MLTLQCFGFGFGFVFICLLVKCSWSGDEYSSTSIAAMKNISLAMCLVSFVRFSW